MQGDYNITGTHADTDKIPSFILPGIYVVTVSFSRKVASKFVDVMRSSTSIKITWF